MIIFRIKMIVYIDIKPQGQRLMMEIDVSWKIKELK